MIVLIIGLGSIGNKHVAALRQIEPKAVVYALRSSQQAQYEEGIININDLDDLPESFDFIIISNPSALHEKTIRDCLKFKVPLFIEKPVITELENCRELDALVTEAAVITYVACNMRFHPVLAYLKENGSILLDKINEVSVYCGSYLPAWRAGSDFRKSYSANPDMGGGVHLDLIHELDYITWLLGYPEAVNEVKRSVSSLNINVIDQAHYVLLYEHFSIYLTLNYFRRDVKREIEFVLEDDTVLVDLINSTVVKKCSQEVLFDSKFDMIKTYQIQLDYFMNCIKNNRQPMNSLSEGLRTLEIALSGKA